MLDYGFDVTLYERSTRIGGLFAYNGDDGDGLPSVMRNTIINTSKEMSAFSDFPAPKDLPNYMHNSEVASYFRSYADHFGVTPLVRTRHDVVQAKPAADYDESGCWDVLVRDLDSNRERLEVFCAVCVCAGHHVFPNVPSFKGQERFRGRIIHTQSFRNANKFRDRRVAVVGTGNSAMDVVAELSHVASKTTRLNDYLTRVLPSAVSENYFEEIMNDVFNHDTYGLKPKHRYSSQHRLVSDVLPSLIISGRVRVKKGIVEFTEDGILFDGDKEVTPLDDVILATGYQVTYPFLPEDLAPVVGNRAQLYKYVFPPQLRHPTLAIMGLVQPGGAVFPVSEMQVRMSATPS
ncbi:hypothetical protein HPB48_018676 [Haemaphysalis longicornis]|uniref:Flavin-containing monooxygenase n=1 Tax=Haemaphysalis longicornis TaxID=44386 RepID=A0A9J6GFV6_HAELO|nr:hypothetical protein HPB48_018676 [Haemaphysalis longicornis]